MQQALLMPVASFIDAMGTTLLQLDSKPAIYQPVAILWHEFLT
jgi:hypothetical protein